MKEYFYKKEYKYMYLSIFFYNFANALSETFGTVMLYKAGLPIYVIIYYSINYVLYIVNITFYPKKGKKKWSG